LEFQNPEQLKNGSQQMRI